MAKQKRKKRKEVNNVVNFADYYRPKAAINADQGFDTFEALTDEDIKAILKEIEDDLRSGNLDEYLADGDSDPSFMCLTEDEILRYTPANEHHNPYADYLGSVIMVDENGTVWDMNTGSDLSEEDIDELLEQIKTGDNSGLCIYTETSTSP